MRHIPVTMATQHPDNAAKPYWHSQPFVSSSAEITECFLCFSDLDIDEYNWDWEGKFVDEAVVDRLLHKHLPYFKSHALGTKKFLTFRIPNPRVEKGFRLARAFMVVITSSQLAQSLGFSHPPIFETILPLTETAQEMMDVQEAYQKLVSIEHKLLNMESAVKHIEVIPLFEQVDKIMESPQILLQYITMHKKKFGVVPEYIRPYCARSDPALNAGLVPTMLALKVALSSYYGVAQETGVRLYPMVGTGSLPFRGSVAPDTVDNVLDEYAGMSTLVIQSAFRYDYPLPSVKRAIKYLHTHLPKKKARLLADAEIAAVKKVIPLFERPYRETVESLAPLINTVSHSVAKRRERVQHIGLFGYSRGIGRVSLPRAITFTAALYSLGLPPEIIGTGRGIREAKKKGLWNDVKHLYVHMKDDLKRAGYFLNKKTVARIMKDSKRNELAEDIAAVEDELHIECGPKSQDHLRHQRLSQRMYEGIKAKKEITQLITEAGILRKSLG